LKIVKLNIETIKEYENNPRHNEEAVDKVKQSIEEFGFKVPIIIDKNNVIITGHTRLKAARELGHKNVPCLIADDLTPEQVKAFRLVDNKVSELASWDEDKLFSELMELKVVEFDVETFGFDTSDIDISSIDKNEVLDKFEKENRSNEIVEDDFDIEENMPEVATAKYGDIYILGNHVLMCGDATKKEDVEKLMGVDVSLETENRLAAN
jgi:site-specific DNA-methyltransferase (adenine-specific)